MSRRVRLLESGDLAEVLSLCREHAEFERAGRPAAGVEAMQYRPCIRPGPQCTTFTWTVCTCGPEVVAGAAAGC